VEFIGEKSAPLAEQLDAYIRENNLSFSLLSTAQVSKAEALQRMQNSDYLLMLCNQELATYIPGKLYDYLSRRVPIIAYGYHGEVSTILDTLEAGRFVSDRDHQQLATALLQPMNSLYDNEALDTWLQSRTRRNQAKLMFEVLKDLP
jgi:hypothetical protein